MDLNHEFGVTLHFLHTVVPAKNCSHRNLLFTSFLKYSHHKIIQREKSTSTFTVAMPSFFESSVPCVTTRY